MNEQLPPVFPSLSDLSSGGGASYSQFVGESLQMASDELALRWLERLVALLPVDPHSIFSTQLLLDHIPGLIQEVGKYVAAPTEEDIAAKAIVVDKARELGQLRHKQQASLHQVLREYDLLGDLLELFVLNQTKSFTEPLSPVATLEVARRLNRAVRVLMQITAGTFIADYTETITEQSSRLDRFNRSISHELRNVLGTLRFGAELLDDERVWPEEARRKQIVATVRRSSERALNIIRSFERLPRTGSDTPREQMVELGETIQEVFRQLKDMADARGVELRASPDFPILYLDSGALELILINLVSNAVKYSDRAKAHRFVEITGHPHDESYELTIQDNGIGIPAAAIGKVFERFSRAHAALDGKLGVEGTGLGLSIVEECVGALNATIALESREGEGTTFSVILPKKLPPIKA
ncbi:MAG TPA: HAMP domain-containing sensor histidine kinase [Vicinamibacterales bacterium]|nr:HAMP domain-containing sensor histidine kinase [Vicinamibacterales bacterium]